MAIRIIRKVGAFFLDVIEVVVIALAIFVMVYLFLFQPHQVRGNSMYPNFEDKEYLLTDKISYRFHDPNRGDVIIFKAPSNEDYEYIKRIIGLPGDKILISQGKIFINNQAIDENYLPEDYTTYGGADWPENEERSVNGTSYFVLGDNRSNSSDSRRWGTVPKENIIGKAWFRYWPPDKVGIIEAVEYNLFTSCKSLYKPVANAFQSLLNYL